MLHNRKKLQKELSFSDFICTFAMSSRVLLYFYCNTNISEISDMTKIRATLCSSGAYKKHQIKVLRKLGS